MKDKGPREIPGSHFIDAFSEDTINRAGAGNIYELMEVLKEHLTKKQYDVLWELFVNGYGQRRAAKILKMSKVNVLRCRNRALKRIRKGIADGRIDLSMQDV